MPRITSILTQDNDPPRIVERWTVEVKAVNKIIARRRAKIFARRKNPTVMGVFFPDEARSIDRTRQTTFGEVFPGVAESLSRKSYEVELIVVRRSDGN